MNEVNDTDKPLVKIRCNDSEQGMPKREFASCFLRIVPTLTQASFI
jgi:hypothetical protein